MPFKPAKPCAYAGCGALTHDRYCSAHARAVARQYDQQRGSAAARGYGRRWQRLRLQFLQRHPLCEACKAEDRLTAATVVDHIEPHRGDQRLFWDQNNWQALCKPCHDAKTAREDGRWGARPDHVADDAA